MSKYTNKEKIIINQCNKGPYHTIITKISNDEFNALVDKLIDDNDSNTLTNLSTIYLNYNRNKIIDYFINNEDVELLLGYLDYCNDFSVPNNELDQKYIVDRLIYKNNIELIRNILNSNSAYFLTNEKEKNRLLDFISKIR